MKIVRIIFMGLLLAASIGFVTSVFAHGMGPHGGQMVDIAPYHAEFQVMPGMIHIYVIDKDKKALPVEGKITGKLLVQMPDGAKKDVALSSMGEALMGTLETKEGDPFVAIATLEMDGKSFVARYSHGSTAVQQ